MRSNILGGSLARASAPRSALLVFLLGLLVLGAAPAAGAAAAHPVAAPPAEAAHPTPVTVSNASDEGWYRVAVRSAVAEPA